MAPDCAKVSTPAGMGRLDRHMTTLTVLMVPDADSPRAADESAAGLAGRGRRQAMERFLAEVEKRAYQMARLSLRDEDDAMDAVQDAMLKLCRHYADRPEGEWRPLFFRILVNQVQDQRRRRTVRGRLFPWWARRESDHDDTVLDVIDQTPDLRQEPQRLIEGEQDLRRVAHAIELLPTRQQQAFLLRTLEGLDIADTARVMGCSEGSVKTHHFRALQALRAALASIDGASP